MSYSILCVRSCSLPCVVFFFFATYDSEFLTCLVSWGLVPALV